MPASSKYDSLSSSPSRSAYLNGPHGSYTATSLEKAGSFREGVKNRTTPLLSGVSKPSMVLPQCDMRLLNSLLSDLKLGLLDQKLARFGDVKKSISNIIGITSEDCIPTTFSMRPLPSSSSEEIRRLKSNLGENSFKARDRAKALNEAISKIDKYFHSVSRKRSRVDISSSEQPNAVFVRGITPRSGPQTHLSACCFEDVLKNWKKILEVVQQAEEFALLGWVYSWMKVLMVYLDYLDLFGGIEGSLSS